MPQAEQGAAASPPGGIRSLGSGKVQVAALHEARRATGPPGQRSYLPPTITASCPESIFIPEFWESVFLGACRMPSADAHPLNYTMSVFAISVVILILDCRTAFTTCSFCGSRSGLFISQGLLSTQHISLDNSIAHAERQVSGLEDCHVAVEELEALSQITQAAAAVARPSAAGAAQDAEAPVPHSADLYPSQAPVFNPDLAGPPRKQTWRSFRLSEQHDESFHPPRRDFGEGRLCQCIAVTYRHRQP